jgi:hypothetical protein
VLGGRALEVEGRNSFEEGEVGEGKRESVAGMERRTRQCYVTARREATEVPMRTGNCNMSSCERRS